MEMYSQSEFKDIAAFNQLVEVQKELEEIRTLISITQNTIRDIRSEMLHLLNKIKKDHYSINP